MIPDWVYRNGLRVKQIKIISIRANTVKFAVYVTRTNISDNKQGIKEIFFMSFISRSNSCGQNCSNLLGHYDLSLESI